MRFTNGESFKAFNMNSIFVLFPHPWICFGLDQDGYRRVCRTKLKFGVASVAFFPLVLHR